MRYGRLAWAFQPSPHDTHDWDGSRLQSWWTPIWWRARKMLIQTSRNAILRADRTTKDLLDAALWPVNWTLGVDKDDARFPNPAKETARTAG